MADSDEEAPQPVWEGPLDEEGLPHGKGRMTYPAPPPAEDDEDGAGGEEEREGDTFEGHMAHGKRHGKGVYTFGGAKGAAYSGEYVEGQRQGQGVMRFHGGGRYEGLWAADLMEGQGTYTHPSGDVYTGGFRGGKKDGNGIYHCKADGCQLHGSWHDGELAEGRWVWRDGSMFAGSFEASKPAQGTHFFSGSGLVQSGRYGKGGAWAGGQVAAGTAAALLL